MAASRQHIIDEIRAIAEANESKAPGMRLFSSKTGIAEHEWRGVHWARWGDALREAGFAANAWQEKLDTALLLAKLAEITRRQQRFPTGSELAILRRSDASIPSPKTIANHFPERADLLAALRQLCEGDQNYKDVIPLIPKLSSRNEEPKERLKDGWVYLIRWGKDYKIGKSDDIERRIKEVQISLPDRAELVHSIKTDDPTGIESYWHKRFANRRRNGEWFALSTADVTAFKRRKFQ